MIHREFRKNNYNMFDRRMKFLFIEQLLERFKEI